MCSHGLFTNKLIIIFKNKFTLYNTSVSGLLSNIIVNNNNDDECDAFGMLFPSRIFVLLIYLLLLFTKGKKQKEVKGRKNSNRRERRREALGGRGGERGLLCLGLARGWSGLSSSEPEGIGLLLLLLVYPNPIHCGGRRLQQCQEDSEMEEL